MDEKDVMVDLKINRKESGLSGEDLAHLLDTSTARISKLHTGKAVMTIEELCSLSLIYGKTVDHLFGLAICKLAKSLRYRLSDMPNEPNYWKAHDQRLDCLNSMTTRLLTLSPEQNASA